MDGITATFIDDTSIYGQLTGAGSIEATLSGDGEIISGVIADYVTAPIYDGEYIITPDTENDIILPTNDKLMKNDVTVEKIPYYETSNISGVTVFIG